MKKKTKNVCLCIITSEINTQVGQRPQPKMTIRADREEVLPLNSPFTEFVYYCVFTHVASNYCKHHYSAK